jgi:hypothetical protein
MDLGFSASLTIVFYPNTEGISLSEARSDMLFYFGDGLLWQYVLLHFFNEQET